MLGGLGVLLVITPINVYLVRKCRAAAKMGMDEKDKRMKLVNEILNGIQVLNSILKKNWETRQAAYAGSEGLDQTARIRSLIKAFTVR